LGSGRAAGCRVPNLDVNGHGWTSVDREWGGRAGGVPGGVYSCCLADSGRRPKSLHRLWAVGQCCWGMTLLASRPDELVVSAAGLLCLRHPDNELSGPPVTGLSGRPARSGGRVGPARRGHPCPPAAGSWVGAPTPGSASLHPGGFRPSPPRGGFALCVWAMPGASVVVRPRSFLGRIAPPTGGVRNDEIAGRPGWGGSLYLTTGRFRATIHYGDSGYRGGG